MSRYRIEVINKYVTHDQTGFRIEVIDKYVAIYDGYIKEG
jgi:septum formation topological specificity factor MinE